MAQPGLQVGFQADFVIVGAGSAGCAAAERLSRDSAIRVLLIEAGGDDAHPWIKVPGGMWYSVGHKRFDWNYPTEPDPSRHGRFEVWPRGKVLGGSSAINGMIYVRGQRADFDAWAGLGNAGWSADAVYAAYRDMERTTIGDAAVRGRGGLLDVQYLRSPHPSAHAFLRACAELGLARRDINGHEQNGADLMQATQRSGWRCSAAAAFLGVARRRRNLQVLTHAQVMVLNLQERRVTGVTLRLADSLVRVEATQGVVLCAGAIATPQLLMLSGIGPAAALQHLGITPVLDVPACGAHLREHVGVDVDRLVTGLGRSYNEEARPLRLALNALRYAFKRDGPAATPGAHAYAFVKTEASMPGCDVQLHLCPQLYAVENGEYTLSQERGISITVNVSHPHSSGTVSLRSSDPMDTPLIAPQLLSDDRDLETLLAGVRVARRLYATAAFRLHVSRGCTAEPESDEALRTWLRQTAYPIYHPVGTCRMGVDPSDVVDPRLNLRGLEGLKVADASVLPRHISGNTNAVAMMIGRRCADFITEDLRAAT